jgi:hypothetical protein
VTAERVGVGGRLGKERFDGCPSSLHHSRVKREHAGVTSAGRWSWDAPGIKNRAITTTGGW